jgi:hypothetical protein
MISAQVIASAVVPTASASYRAAILCFGPFRPFAAVHQFDRCWGVSGHCADITQGRSLTHVGSGVCIAAVQKLVIKCRWVR